MYFIGFSGFEIVVILYCIVVVANVTHYQKFNIFSRSFAINPRTSVYDFNNQLQISN